MKERIDRVGELLDLDLAIYDLEITWNMKDFQIKAKSETEGIALANERKSILKELTDTERTDYYNRRLMQYVLEA